MSPVRDLPCLGLLICANIYVEMRMPFSYGGINASLFFTNYLQRTIVLLQ